MMTNVSFTRAYTCLVLLLVVSAALSGTVVAQQDDNSTDGEDGDEDEDDDTVIIDLSGVLDALQDLVDAITGWGEKLTKILLDVLFGPFRALAKALIDVVVYIIASYPTVHPNPDVSEIHRITFVVAVALSGLIFAGTGILFITGPVLGVGYSQVRRILPRTILALIFGAIGPILLQYAVELSRAATIAFRPTDSNFLASAQILGELGLVAVINSLLLLAVGVLFAIRNVYILFAAAISPLIAIGWAVPYAKRYADSLIGTFWAALLIGPLDMLVFNLALTLLKVRGGRVPKWLMSMAALTLLLIVPYLVFNAGQSMVGQGLRMLPSRSSKSKSTDRSDRRRWQSRRSGTRRQRIRRKTSRTRSRASNALNSLKGLKP